MVTTGSRSTFSLAQARCAISDSAAVSTSFEKAQPGMVRRLSVHPAPMDQSLSTFISFGRFRLHPSQRLLVEEGRPVSVGGHALDLLIALSERPGEVVSKHELVARIWAGLTVEESNLRVQIAALRRTLHDGQAGERYISTVNGRGYCFVAPIVHHYETDQNVLVRDAEPVAISARMPSPHHDLLDSISEGLLGRPLVAIVNDTDLSRRFSEMLAAYQLQASALGVALLFIPGANLSVQEQEHAGTHKA
jgi:DNA-binding winged helix-turn-helix (wHTH) protein